MDITYIVIDRLGKENLIEASTPAEALGLFLKRGRFGLGNTWVLTRQPNGWIVASNKADKTLARTYHKLREQEWNRSMR